MRRDDICIYVSPADRARLEGIVADVTGFVDARIYGGKKTYSGSPG
jgi:hypothetical protein